MPAFEFLKQEKKKIFDIASKYGVGNVRVFGSTVRGEAGSSSDLDLLVLPKPGFTLLKQAALVRELEQLLQCKVDVVSERGLRPRVRDRVLREARTL